MRRAVEMGSWREAAAVETEEEAVETGEKAVETEQEAVETEQGAVVDTEQEAGALGGGESTTVQVETARISEPQY